MCSCAHKVLPPTKTKTLKIIRLKQLIEMVYDPGRPILSSIAFGAFLTIKYEYICICIGVAVSEIR